jgi:molybdopterin molybdotransferase
VTEFESRVAHWLSVTDAQHRVLSRVVPLPSELVATNDALGSVLAEPIAARATLPAWDNSAMDGYAVRGHDVRGASSDAPIRLRVIGAARAGASAGVVVEPGCAVRIMTGGRLPDGADSVVRVEDTDRERGQGGEVEIRSDRDAGRNVRPAGQDMRAGDVVLEAGALLGPGALALAATAGSARVAVHRRPTVAVLSSGDELRPLSEWSDVEAGRAVVDSNGLMLAACATASGCNALPPRLARDNEASIREEIAVSMDADVLLTSGGASMGEADLIKRVLDDLGFELDFWRVTLQPGSPFSFGFLPRSGRAPLPVFGLPGNPASAFVTFELFARPFLLASAGHRAVHRPVVRARAATPLTGTGTLTHFHRVTLEPSSDETVPRAHLTGPQGSGLVHSVGRATGLAVVPRGLRGIAEGEVVSVMITLDTPGATAEAGCIWEAD